VTLHTRGRKGTLNQSVWVQTDDPETPRLELKLTGTVDVLVELVPGFLQFGQVAVGTKRTEVVQVVAKEFKDLQVQSAEPTHPQQVQAKVVQTPDGPAVQVTFQAGSVTGLSSGHVRVATNHPKMPEVSLNYRAEVVGDLSVTPSRVTFLKTPEGQAPEPVEVQVTSASGKAFRIVKATDAAGLVQARIKAGKKGTTVLLTAPEAPKPMGGRVVLTTNRKDQPELVLNYVLGAAQPPSRAGIGTPMPRVERRPPGPIQRPVRRLPQPGR
jgi:hypothetical protein